jgi:predicted nucleotide-binding protein
VSPAPPYDELMSENRSQHPGSVPSVFIGSSSEGLEVVRYLQNALERDGVCEVTTWEQGVFHASSYTMEALSQSAKRADFAVLVATADDSVESRGKSHMAVRDNVIFELGLFIGALGRERTYIVADQTGPELQLPSDLNGLTWLPYNARSDKNMRAAVSGAALEIRERIRELGSRSASHSGVSTHNPSNPYQALDIEIERICSAARAQGWRVKTNSDTTLRLQSHRGQRFTFAIGEPVSSRVELRGFAAELRANGLRISQSVRRPVENAPLIRN